MIFSMITKISPTSNSIYLRYFNLALSTLGKFYNITNLAVANASYYNAKVRCSPYNQLNTINNSFLIYLTIIVDNNQCEFIKQQSDFVVSFLEQTNQSNKYFI